jgi:hypothetical protein
MFYVCKRVKSSRDKSHIIWPLGEGNLHVATVPIDEGNGKAQRVFQAASQDTFPPPTCPAFEGEADICKNDSNK